MKLNNLSEVTTALIDEANHLISERRFSRGYPEGNYQSLSRSMQTTMVGLVTAIEDLQGDLAKARDTPHEADPTLEEAYDLGEVAGYDSAMVECYAKLRSAQVLEGALLLKCAALETERGQQATSIDGLKRDLAKSRAHSAHLVGVLAVQTSLTESAYRVIDMLSFTDAAPVIKEIEVAAVEAELEEWAQFFDRRGGTVGGSPLTDEMVAEFLRGPRPWGASEGEQA